MGSRFPARQLSNGLYVSGRPEQPREKTIIINSATTIYTGGDIKNSGDLGKMFDIPADTTSKSRKSGPVTVSGPISSVSSAPNASSTRQQKSSSGPITRPDKTKRSSGPQSGQNSGPQLSVLSPTGLITSGLLKSSGPLSEPARPNIQKTQNPGAVTNLSGQSQIKSKSKSRPNIKQGPPRGVFWAIVLLFVMGFVAGGFILGAVRNFMLLVVVGVLFVGVLVIYLWNLIWGERMILGFMERYADAELRSAKDGQFIRVTGIVTCGSVPLETSFQKVPRCVYTSASLHEYRGWHSKTSANPNHRRFTWGLRSLERQAVDFYVSDFQSGLRALVKAGHGARVTPFVDECTVIEANAGNKDTDLPPELLHWLVQRNLSSDDRIMRLREGYIKEGTTVSVMGVVRRNESVLMIVPPSEPVSTGCQWARCFLPAILDSLLLHSLHSPSKMDDSIPV